jgi:hypothetical protein
MSQFHVGYPSIHKIEGKNTGAAPGLVYGISKSHGDYPAAQEAVCPENRQLILAESDILHSYSHEKVH